MAGAGGEAVNAPMLFDVTANPKHPAKYTDALLLTMAQMLKGRRRILDPFGGTGKVFLLEHWLGAGVEIQATELEPEFAAINPRTTLGNALCLPWPDRYFDAVCTSPAYGNRMADPLFWGDIGMTYASELHRELHPDNGGRFQWGDEYKSFHRKAWAESRRVLRFGGAFVLNIKDHIRRGERKYVTQWHIDTLCGLGFRLLRHERINTPSMRYGANSDKRVEYESVILFELGEVKP
jgi:tRNA G10  N-methylase Trm11